MTSLLSSASLLSDASGSNIARLKASATPESGAWLQALPSPQLGTLLDNDSLLIAIELRLACKVYEQHRCICGAMVEEDGHHGLSVKVNSSGRRRCLGTFASLARLTIVPVTNKMGPDTISTWLEV
ncbi:hypothetical protein MSG28_005249 [Choristoneura fumiferana]|uniref:Uncharacterized protein n=1 Tax=Choristoneura fumiferana TaxID=7141 RepID=A0ACC0JQF4_CHOFU|nr:hypothetical protein MSG28_005249 [Choristoneura fumiferana]